jgi:hypothetical protein
MNAERLLADLYAMMHPEWAYHPGHSVKLPDGWLVSSYQVKQGDDLRTVLAIVEHTAYRGPWLMVYTDTPADWSAPLRRFAQRHRIPFLRRAIDTQAP